ncbi:hypothetical protein HanXRQr2_Chr10g0454791 [Helianthus annuus]|uniref:Uncharacterized protein n=1 Tax=Helianthus annuus TaxID=4232 RepID=A0A251TP32_HELAN|nr:hypothetical protein HanXRQr2_Chr10g0454791 [Helianthus annuus]KAJ0884900.1 hypothetical protein HanPSC8_Chr10g0439181 [Helianthus annuus]
MSVTAAARITNKSGTIFTAAYDAAAGNPRYGSGTSFGAIWCCLCHFLHYFFMQASQLKRQYDDWLKMIVVVMGVKK